MAPGQPHHGRGLDSPTPMNGAVEQEVIEDPAFDVFENDEIDVTAQELYHYPVYPVESLSNTGNIRFEIPPNAEYWIKWSEMRLSYRAKIQIKDATKGTFRDLVATDKMVIPINNAGHSFFSDMSVTINHVRVEGGDNNYPMNAYFNNSLQYTHTAKTTHMQAEGFFIPSADTANKAWDDKKHVTNQEMFKTMIKLSPDGGLYYDIPIKVDLLQQVKNFPPGFQLMLELVRSAPEFCLFAEEATNTYQVVFSDMKLDITFVKPASKVNAIIQRAITSNVPILYQFNNLNSVRHTIPAGINTKHISNVFSNNQPKIGFFVFVEHGMLSNLGKRPFIFNNESTGGEIHAIALRAEGRLIGGSALHGNSSMQCFSRFTQALGLFNSNEENGIDFEAFKKYYFIYAFDCTTNSHIQNMQTPTTVQYDLDIQFKYGLKKAFELYAFFIKDKRLMLKMDGTVISDDYIAPQTRNPAIYLKRRAPQGGS